MAAGKLSQLKLKGNRLVAEGLPWVTIIFGLGAFMALPAVGAAGSVAWVVVSGTTPDLLSPPAAIAVGLGLGIILLAGALAIGLRFGTKGSFPDYATGYLLPCAAVFMLSCFFQPIAAHLTKHRLKTAPRAALHQPGVKP